MYPPSAGKPGPRDPGLTPYIVAFERFFAEDRYEICALITGTQMSKTDGVLDVIGWRLDTKPRPQLYVGPSRDFVVEQFEPRLMALFDQADRLKHLVARGKRNKKTRKIVNGVSIRLAWAGSATSLASDQAGDVYVDEYDKMARLTSGEGDPFTLAKARADTFADRKIAVTSTPKAGRVEIERCERSGLEFWKMADPKDIGSPIWAKWQAGTRHHWAWQCPHCEDWFIPRMRDLRYPENATPAEARRGAYLCCPNNGCVIDEEHKEAMNDGGRFVAPGEVLRPDGSSEGDPPDSNVLSLWVSGLASPFVTWGERIEEVLLAEQMGDDEACQGAINKCGELWAPAAGDAPEWTALKRLRQPYSFRTRPDGVGFLTAGVDVQGGRLVYVIRGWGARQESWLIEHGELFGDTDQHPVWLDLARLIEAPIAGAMIRRVFIDSGFRPGKKDTVPEHMVYDFVRRFPRLCYATKGYDRRDTPLSVKRIDVDAKGGKSRFGVDLVRLDADYFKSWVHGRLKWPEDQPGAWHLSQDASDEYLKQLVSESRVSDGKWAVRSRNNHFLDCEAMAYAAAYMLGVQRLSDEQAQRLARSVQEPERDSPRLAPPPPARRESSWLGDRTNNWLSARR
ncbi:MAG: terminase gpA endonuclease subunit [Beijerinckiaceae bacterium]